MLETLLALISLTISQTIILLQLLLICPLRSLVTFVSKGRWMTYYEFVDE